MKNKTGLDIHSVLLLVFGAMLLFWGGRGLISTFGSDSNNEELDDEGFLPYAMPIDAGLDNNGSVFQGPPDQTIEVPVVSLESLERPEAEVPGDVLPLDWKETAPIPPDHIVISKIELVAPVLEAGLKKTWMEARQYEQWLAPDEFAAGWHFTSARLGEIGNTVLNGHHNTHGKVFVDLNKLEPGDLISVFGNGIEFKYLVVNKMILPERKVSAEVRLENARWIMPSADERLTLVTCWPYESNTHRLVIVARPLRAPGQ